MSASTKIGVDCPAKLTSLTALSKRVRPPERREPHLRFDVVVPAHDEATGIAAHPFNTVFQLMADGGSIGLIGESETDRRDEWGFTGIVAVEPPS